MTGNIREGDWIRWVDAERVYRGEVEKKRYGFYEVRLEDGTRAYPDVRAATKTDPPSSKE